MSKKVQKSLYNLSIEKIASEGKCLGRQDGKVVFVPYTAPGDVVNVLLLKNRKSYAEGKIIEYVEYSKDRVNPFCDYFGLCGGCKWQHLPYEKQISFKQEHVLENFRHLGGLTIHEIKPIIGADKTEFYRNKLDFTFTDRRWLTEEELASEESFEERSGAGFHVPGRFDGVLDIEKCHLQSDFSNDIRNFLRDFGRENGLTFYNVKAHKGLLRNLIIRNTSEDKQMVLVQFGEDDKESIDLVMNAIWEKFPFIESLQYIINTKQNETFGDLDIHLFKGQSHLMEPFKRWDGSTILFKISPKSFFQTNNGQAEKLYKETFEMAKLTGEEVVYDLYTGTGTIANYVANKAKKVVGVEYVEDAIADAKVNAELNKIGNTVFYAGDMKDVLNDKFVQDNGHPDVIITDPPRAGMHDDVVETILRISPKRIVYVSCNPASQARDLQKLVVKYDIEEIQPVDMFPHTHHVENIVSLVLKQ